MSKKKFTIGLGLVLLLLFSFALAEKWGKAGLVIKEEQIEKVNGPSQPSETQEPQTVVKQVSSEPKAASFILVTDVIDAFGGQKSNSGCDRYIFAGGQSSAIGPGTSTNYKLYAGFVQSTVVKCGDANGDGSLTVSDVVYLVNYLFKGGPIPKPYEAGEANCDGKLSVSDVVYLINYLFKGGPVPIC